MSASRPRLVAGVAALAGSLAIAYGFYEFARATIDPGVRAFMDRQGPELGAFAFWCVPLALLLAWIAGRGKGGRVWRGAWGGILGAVVGALYAWAALAVNLDLLAFPFPILWTWTFAGGLALLFAWTSWRPAALAISIIPVAIAVAWTAFELRAARLPPVMFVAVFRPGVTEEQKRVFDQRDLVQVMPRGFDPLPGVMQQGAAVAGPGGIELAGTGDTAAYYVQFTGRSTRGQRAEVEARARRSPLVASTRWLSAAATREVLSTYDREIDRLMQDAPGPSITDSTRRF